MRKPEAVPSAHKCSVCGLDWRKHGEKPTLETCVELLLAAKAARVYPAESTVRAPIWLEHNKGIGPGGTP